MVEIDADDENLMLAFKKGILSIWEMIEERRWVELLIRIGIFIGLVFVVHAIFVWTIYSVIIPILQRYIMDSILEQAKLSLLSGDYSKYKGMYEQFTKF